MQKRCKGGYKRSDEHLCKFAQRQAVRVKGIHIKLCETFSGHKQGMNGCPLL